MKAALPISCTVHGSILVHSSVLYWTSLHVESLIAILLSAVLMIISVHAAFQKRDAPEGEGRSWNSPDVRRRERLLRTTFLVILPLTCYYWFVLRPAMAQMAPAQVEATYALFAFQVIVGVLGEIFLEFMKDVFGHPQ